MQKKRLSINALQLARTLMWAAILLIVAFQSYWIRRLYKDEREGLRKETNGIFRDVVYNLQVERFKKDTHFFQSAARPNLFAYNAVNAIRKEVANLRKDSAGTRISFDTTHNMVFVRDHKTDTVKTASPPRIMFRSNGDLPPEVITMMKNGQGERYIVRDSAMLKQIVQGTGFGMVMGSVRKSSDSIQHTIRQDVLIHTPDSAGKRKMVKRDLKVTPSAAVNIRIDGGADRSFVRLIASGESLDDSLPIPKVDSAYKKELAKANIALPFRIRMGKDDSLHRRDTAAAAQFATRPTIVGFAKPNWYQAEFDNPASFLLRKISPQILFSIFLVAFTSVAFVFLYRNLSAQRRLTEMKNDFISNITHELKTPIATVSVAVEALRNFGGIQSPERTKEYLDISASELQRLSLLVDKVLKLSMFENRELELKKETFDLKELVGEVLNTMKLQFDKLHAKVDLSVQGHYFSIEADRLHITSVIYNLLDNALKYSKDKPEIDVKLRHDTDSLVLEVADKGIGIPDMFKGKIFDKFFRVPTGDHHNIKGYGLGLSYVAHVVKKHGGTIGVESEPGKGSTFTVKLPIA